MKQLLCNIILFITILVNAQETLPIYQQYLLDGKFLHNPAHYGETNKFVLNGMYQKQFSQLEQSPNVQSIGGHSIIIDRLGVGATFFRDQNGAISANGFSIGAAYFIPLDDEDKRENQFSFGMNANFYNTNINLSMINADDKTDPLLHNGINNQFLAYTNIGLQATYKGAFGGVAIVDIPLNNGKAIINGIEPSPTKFILNAGYDWLFAERISIEPSIFLNLNTNSSRMIDYNLLAKLKGEEDFLAFGISYRTAKEPYGNQRLNLAPILKGHFNGFTLGMVYNIEVSKISQTNGNSFLISLGYMLPIGK